MHQKSVDVLRAAALGVALAACAGPAPVAGTHVEVSVTPPAASLAEGQTEQFSATLSGTADTSVSWAVQEAAGGTVSGAGLYTAPAATGTYHVVATSKADPTRSAVATVTVAAAGNTCTPESDAAFCSRLGTSCGTLSATDNCGAARTATCGAACPASSKESWVWVYTDYSGALAAITANKASFTHVSPTFYTVNYSYQSGVAYYSNCPNISNCTGNGSNSFSGMTTRQFTDKVTALGLATVPIIYGGAGNSGTDAGILNLLDNVNGAGDAFVAAMTTEAVNNGYAGYNIDWEAGSAVNRSYADKFVAFADKFKAALAQHGMSLSVDAIVSDINGSWCSGNNGYLDFSRLAASSVDRIMIEDYTSHFGKATTSCQSTVLSSSSPALCDFTFTGMLDMMCSPNLPLDKAVIGVEADPGATNPIAGAAFSAMKSYGFTRVAVWPQAPFMNTSNIQPAGATWYALLQDFLTH